MSDGGFGRAMMVGGCGFGNGCGDAVEAESDADNQRLDMVSSFWLGRQLKDGCEQVNDDNASVDDGQSIHLISERSDTDLWGGADISTYD